MDDEMDNDQTAAGEGTEDLDGDDGELGGDKDDLEGIEEEGDEE